MRKGDILTKLSPFFCFLPLDLRQKYPIFIVQRFACVDEFRFLFG